MSQCVTLNADGTFVVTSDAPAACQGYVLLTSTEYTASQSSTVLWRMPTPEEMNTVTQYGFYLPLLIYVVSYWTGLLANFFDSHQS